MRRYRNAQEQGLFAAKAHPRDRWVEVGDTDSWRRVRRRIKERIDVNDRWRAIVRGAACAVRNVVYERS